jgi:hypothetical protein
LWKVTLLLLTLALTGGLALSVAIGAGWNDPRPPAPPDWRFPGPLLLQAAPPDRRAARFLDRPAESFTLEAVATLLGGSAFNGYGLIFRARQPDRYEVFAVGSDGYLAVLWVEGETETPLLGWQQFPHIRRGRATNRLRISCADGTCRFWVNDEYVAALPDEMGASGDVGLWVRRFEGEAVRVEFAQVAMWGGSR